MAQDMADKLLAAGFKHTGPQATALSDPIADTPMVVTLDELRPYDHDPRVTRNPAYDDIKSSIRTRGLDAPPAITRRPGQAFYIIRNGGNTRLAILRELWAETKDERFFRIPCVFRPWPERGDIVVLTGHLAENELRGGLTFIERALGIEQAREFYEQESGQQPLSQSELARRLAADGFAVPQPHISRMQDTVRYLLPAIPNVLYGGLGRRQVERLTVLRRAAERTWDWRAKGRHLGTDFAALFHDVLALFDISPDAFSIERVQDELIGQMAEQLGVNYDLLNLEIDDSESRQRALTSEPTQHAPATPAVVPAPAEQVPSEPAQREGASRCPVTSAPPSPLAAAPVVSDARDAGTSAPGRNAQPDNDRLQSHVVSAAPTTDRLQSIQRLVSDHMDDPTGDPRPDFNTDALRAIPVQVGGLYPISDVWYIDPGLDTPSNLRTHIAQLALEIAEEATVADFIESNDQDLGFVCKTSEPMRGMPPLSQAVLRLLQAVSATPAGSDRARLTEGLTEELAPLLHGHGSAFGRLSDAALVKLFRLLRLARRLLDLEVGDVGLAS